jgi:hypothetical protein
MPIHMGMGSMPMSFGSNNIPPLEALPLPLTIEEFEQEQALQRELKKAYGGVPGMAYRGVGGYRGGYRGPPSQWRPGGGRGTITQTHTYIQIHIHIYTEHVLHRHALSAVRIQLLQEIRR